MPDVYGDGSIVRRTDGRLEIRVRVGGRTLYDHIPARLVARDPREAAKLAERRRSEMAGMRDDGSSGESLTLADYLASWTADLDRRKTRRLGVRTLEHYRLAVSHVPDWLGRKRLRRVTEGDVQRWLDGLEAAPRKKGGDPRPASPRTVAHHRAVLRNALNAAVQRRLIARNPALGVRLPELPESHGSPMTIAECRALLDTSRGSRWHALWALALDTGWRESELLGLARDDVDCDARTATLRHQLRRARGAGVEGRGEHREAQWDLVRVKRPRRLATVSIGEATAEAVRAHRLMRGSERKPGDKWHGLLFASATRLPVGGGELLRAWHAALDAAGVPRRRFHDARVTSATVMRELGVPEDIRMLRLGHSTTAMARHYSVPRDGVDRAAADALGAALAEASG